MGDGIDDSGKYPFSGDARTGLSLNYPSHKGQGRIPR
jgi:hypothetical protein